MDVETYDNPRVEKALQPLTLIRVNVTASDAASRNLLHHFRLRDSNMAEDHLVLEQLREIQAEQDATREHGHEIMARLSGMA